jgi:hypothetical protein
MSRSSRSEKSSKSSLDRAKALPWALLLLSSSERERLLELVRASGGRLSTLSEKERKELRKLSGKLDLRGMGDELRPLLRRGRRRRG